MDHRRLLFFFCFISLGFKAFAAVFAVTSNAGSGVGTLHATTSYLQCGIILDESSVQIKVAGCNGNNGSITGLQISGATAYQWVDAGNKIVGTSPDLQNVAAGDYTLTASNAFGCSKTSKTYHIGLQPPTQYPAYPSTIYLACTGKSNGGVNVPVDTLVHFERWVNDLGQTAGTGIGVSNVPAGVYQLYLTDSNGCETLYDTYIVPSIPQLTIQTGSGQVSNEQCTIKDGSIKGIQVLGGRPPYTYAWLDASNNKIASTLDVTGLSAGTYTFTVNDGTTCGIVSAAYTIQNQDVAVPAPLVNSLQVCGSGEVMLRVTNPSALYSYRLYDSNSSTNAVDEQATGVFKINVKTSTTFYISQFSGSCESPRAEVQVNVGITSVDIDNAFTPNGDGINDYWKIADIENYPNATVQVFNRYGDKVFESKGYTKPFDGTYNGGQLPTGVYYYIINLSNACSLITGSLTIIR
jgi:gliding motility-associated-like protein